MQIYTTRLMIVNREENLNVNNTVLCKCITFVSVDEINRNMEFIALILFVWLIVYIRRQIPKWRGKYAEKRVQGKLMGLPDDYVVFNNLLYQRGGCSTQIDHIVVSPYGVFVIETKGYKGWILGGEKSAYWTQVIYKHKYQFYNPIMQNETHVRCLRRILNNDEQIPIMPIVVFNNSATLKVRVDNYIVVNRRRLNKAILQFHDRILDQAVIDGILERIRQGFAMPQKENMKEHVRNVRKMKKRTKTMIRQHQCPRCGGKLVARHGKYGDFYGCSNYPRCNFVRPR